MQNPESGPVSSNTAEENISKTKQDTKEKFISYPTHIEGVYYRFTPDADRQAILDATKRKLRGIVARGKVFYNRDRRIKKDSKTHNSEKTFWRELAATHEGWRGIVSNTERSKYILTVSPQTQTTYDRDSLKASLGDVEYKNTVKEVLMIEINGLQSIEGDTKEKDAAKVLIKDIKKTLRRIGVSKEEIDILMRWSVNLDVDKDRLNRLIQEGKVILSENAQSENTTFRVAAEPFRQSVLPDYSKTQSKQSGIIYNGQ